VHVVYGDFPKLVQRNTVPHGFPTPQHNQQIIAAIAVSVSDALAPRQRSDHSPLIARINSGFGDHQPPWPALIPELVVLRPPANRQRPCERFSLGSNRRRFSQQQIERNGQARKDVDQRLMPARIVVAEGNQPPRNPKKKRRSHFGERKFGAVGGGAGENFGNILAAVPGSIDSPNGTCCSSCVGEVPAMEISIALATKKSNRMADPEPHDLHAQLAHVAERRRRGGRVLGVGSHDGRPLSRLRSTL
jgi:hypothetical protein